MKNKKGYLLVEIIVASVIAMTLAYFLIDLAINLSNKNDDYLVDTLLESDKAYMTKEIMNDISNYNLIKLSLIDSNTVEFMFDENITKRLKIEKNDENKFIYGKYNNNNFINDEYYVEKKFNDKLNVGNINIENLCYYSDNYVSCEGIDISLVTKGLIRIQVPAKTIYSDYNYGIEIDINYNTKETDIYVQTYNNALENKDYKDGEIVKWSDECNLQWNVLKDNGDSVTLISTSNYKTGIYGNSSDFFGSVASTVLNDEFITSCSKLRDAIEEKTLIKDTETDTYVRLVKKEELNSNIPNVSSTPFWTMSSLGGKIYLGDVTGSLLQKYSEDGEKGNFNLYINKYDRYYRELECENMGGYYWCPEVRTYGDVGVEVIAPANEWYVNKPNDNQKTDVVLSPSSSNITIKCDYEEGIGSSLTSSIKVCPCDNGTGTHTEAHFLEQSDYQYIGYYKQPYTTRALTLNVIARDLVSGEIEDTIIQYADNYDECSNKPTIYLPGISPSCGNTLSSYQFALSSGKTVYYNLVQKSFEEIGYRPVITLLKKKN